MGTIEHMYLIGMYDTLLNLHNRVITTDDRIYDTFETESGITIITSLIPYCDYITYNLELIPVKIDVVAIKGNNIIAYVSRDAQIFAAIFDSINDPNQLTEEKIKTIKKFVPKGFNKFFSSLISLGQFNKEDQIALESEADRLSLMSASMIENQENNATMVFVNKR